MLKSQQALTELEETSKRASEKALIDAQELKVDAETLLTGKQGSLVDAQATDVAADTTLKGKQGSLVDAQTTDVGADTTLKGKQGDLIDKQVVTENENAQKVAAETDLIAKQQGLVDAQKTSALTDATLKSQQALTELEETSRRAAEKALLDAQELKTDAETLLMGSQKTQLDAQTAIEATAEKDFYDGVVAGTQATYRDYAAEMRMMGIQESMFQQTPAYKKVELIKDAEKLRTATATDTSTCRLYTSPSPRDS